MRAASGRARTGLGAVGIDPEAPELPAMGFPMTAPEMRRIQFARLLDAWRLVLIPMALLGSLAIARVLRPRRR